MRAVNTTKPQLPEVQKIQEMGEAWLGAMGKIAALEKSALPLKKAQAELDAAKHSLAALKTTAVQRRAQKVVTVAETRFIKAREKFQSAMASVMQDERIFYGILKDLGHSFEPGIDISAEEPFQSFKALCTLYGAPVKSWIVSHTLACLELKGQDLASFYAQQVQDAGDKEVKKTILLDYAARQIRENEKSNWHELQQMAAANPWQAMQCISAALSEDASYNHQVCSGLSSHAWVLYYDLAREILTTEMKKAPSELASSALSLEMLSVFAQLPGFDKYIRQFTPYWPHPKSFASDDEAKAEQHALYPYKVTNREIVADALVQLYYRNPEQVFEYSLQNRCLLNLLVDNQERLLPILLQNTKLFSQNPTAFIEHLQKLWNENTELDAVGDYVSEVARYIVIDEELGIKGYWTDPKNVNSWRTIATRVVQAQEFSDEESNWSAAVILHHCTAEQDWWASSVLGVIGAYAKDKRVTTFLESVILGDSKENGKQPNREEDSTELSFKQFRSAINWFYALFGDRWSEPTQKIGLLILQESKTPGRPRHEQIALLGIAAGCFEEGTPSNAMIVGELAQQCQKMIKNPAVTNKAIEVLEYLPALCRDHSAKKLIEQAHEAVKIAREQEQAKQNAQSAEQERQKQENITTAHNRVCAFMQKVLQQRSRQDLLSKKRGGR